MVTFIFMHLADSFIQSNLKKGRKAMHQRFAKAVCQRPHLLSSKQDVLKKVSATACTYSQI